MQVNCPTDQHFHVTARGVDQINLTFVILEDEPQNALEKVLGELPVNWIGGIEVSDDDSLGPSDMPLIDFWKE